MRALIVAAALLATLAAAQSESCELELYVLLDTSNSIKDRNDECLKKLQDDRNDPDFAPKRRACWELFNEYARAAADLVKDVCNRAHQPDPLVSLVTFKCPNSGKTHKVIMEHESGKEAVDAGFERLNEQGIEGYSCALGSLEQTDTWIKREESAGKKPIVLFLTDGKLSRDKQVSIDLTREMADRGAVMAAATVFTRDADASRLQAHTADRDLVLDAADPSSLLGLGLHLPAIGGVTIDTDNLSTCSARQRDCLAARADALTTTATCPQVADQFTGLASCLGAGCVGLDLTPFKEQCTELSAERKAQDPTCALDCTDVARHINAQDHPVSLEVDQGAGYEPASPRPALLTPVGEAQADAIGQGAAALDWRVADLSGGAGAPLALPGSTRVLVLRNTPEGSQLACVDAASREVVWTFAPSAGARFRAAPVLDANAAHVLIGDTNGVFLRIDATSGAISESWELGPGPITAAATVPAGGGYVVVAVDGLPGASPARLHKIILGAASRRAWSRAVCDETSPGDRAVRGIALLEDRAVLVACRRGALQRVSFVSGLTQWTRALAGPVRAAPLVWPNESRVFVVSGKAADDGDAELACYELSGERAWGVTLGALVDAEPFVLEATGSVLVATRAGELLELAADTGAVLSRLALPEAGHSVAPLVQDAAGKVLLAQGSAVHVIGVDGAEPVLERTIETSGWLSGSPLVLDGGLFVSNNASALERVRFESTLRRRLWHTDNEVWPISAVVITIILAIAFLALAESLYVLWRRDTQREQQQRNGAGGAGVHDK